MTPKHQELILDILNGFRQKIASGNLAGHAPAKRMSCVVIFEQINQFSIKITLNCIYLSDVGQTIGRNVGLQCV